MSTGRVPKCFPTDRTPLSSDIRTNSRELLLLPFPEPFDGTFVVFSATSSTRSGAQSVMTPGSGCDRSQPNVEKCRPIALAQTSRSITSHLIQHHPFAAVTASSCCCDDTSSATHVRAPCSRFTRPCPAGDVATNSEGAPRFVHGCLGFLGGDAVR